MSKDLEKRALKEDLSYLPMCIAPTSLIVGGGIGYLIDCSLNGDGMKGAVIGGLTAMIGTGISTLFDYFYNRIDKKIDKKYAESTDKNHEEYSKKVEELERKFRCQ